MNSEEKVLGTEKELLEDFLKLFRDKNRLVDIANLFLELEAGVSGINIGITNQRDALSHFVTFLSDADTKTYEQRKEQLYEAEEHLRRAIFESYQNAVSINLLKCKKLLDEYQRHVLPLRSTVMFSTAPPFDVLTSILGHINKMFFEARRAKSRNMWDEKWEEGLKKVVEAMLEIKKLIEILESNYCKAIEYEGARKIEEDATKNKKLTHIGIILSVVSLIVGIFFGSIGTYFTIRPPTQNSNEISSSKIEGLIKENQLLKDKLKTN